MLSHCYYNCLSVVVQWLSCVWPFVTRWTAASQASLSSTLSRSLLKVMSTGLVMVSNRLILCRPLLNHSQHQDIFQSVLHIRWPKYWGFSFNICPCHEYSRLTSFRIDCFDLLAVQRTLKSLLQHHSSKVLILWCSAFLIIHLSRLYMTTGKTIALTIWTSIEKVMSLLFNMLSRNSGNKSKNKQMGSN